MYKLLTQVLVRYDKLGSTKNDVDFQFSATNLAKKHFCGENKNFLEIYKPKAPERLSKYIGTKKTEFDFLNIAIPEDEWLLVYRTEYITNNKLCLWNPHNLDKVKICSGLEDIPLMFKVMDYALHSGKHKLVGGIIKTFSELKNAQSQGANSELKKKDRTDRGFLKVESLKESRIFLLETSSMTSLTTSRAE
jgi:hypothetical protein